MLKEETINKRIHRAVENFDLLKNESLEVKRYFEEFIKGAFICLENDDDGMNYTSTDNLNFAIESTFYDGDFNMIYEEAKREAK